MAKIYDTFGRKFGSQRAANVPMEFEVDGKFAGYCVVVYVLIIRVKYNC